MTWFMLIALGTIWGSSYLFIKVAGADFPPLTLVAIRTTLAMFTLVLFLALQRQPLPPRRWRTWLPLIAMGVFNGVIPYTLITWGETEISSSLAGILTGAMPIFTVIIAHLFTQDEKLNTYKVLGIILGFAGVVILFLPGLGSGLKLSVLGELAVVTAACSYALSGVIAHKYVRGLSHAATAFGQFFTAAAVMLPLSLAIDRPLGLHPSLEPILMLLTLAVLNTAVAYLFFYWLIEHTGPTTTSLVTYVSPVSALFLGWVILGERLDWTTFAGLLAIILGVALVNRKPAAAPLPAAVEAE